MVDSVIATGGQLIKQELDTLQVQQPGIHVLQTNAHSLQCSHVLHLNISTNRQYFVSTVLEAFMKAEQVRAKTVAIPCFGEFSLKTLF